MLESKWRFRFACWCCLWLALNGTPSEANDLLPPASRRFASAKTQEVPDFQQHVVPLLGRLGCNGRSCHGSFQGRGGFRLSLFGFDFSMDHDSLTGAAESVAGRRIDSDNVKASLILQKPTMVLDHEGGERFQVDSWAYHLIQAWISAGAPAVQDARTLSRLVVEPTEVVFTDSQEATELRVIAYWEDGHQEDVTCLSRFRTNDPTVVNVDENGSLQSTGSGDTHVIVLYDNGVAAVPVIRAYENTRAPDSPAPGSPRTEIDRLVQRKLDRLGVVPSEVCNDAEFLRRVSIDMTGTLPTPQEIEAFLQDRSPTKRRNKIDELIERPAFSAWWTNKLCDFTGCNPRQQAELGQETAEQWYRWIYQRLRENTPYDELVERIVLARGREADHLGYEDYARSVSAYYREENPADFADRYSLPHYWTRRTVSEPKDKALAFAHSFLGIQLQCAQCHKHPWDQWTQQDFESFSRFFESVTYGVRPEDQQSYRNLAQQVGLRVRSENGEAVRGDVLRHAENGRTIPWRELFVAPREEPVELSLLRSRRVNLAADDDPREAIMQWMRESERPWLAQAFVNRVWASYFHMGIVDPPDDFNPANPPSNQPLLDWLTREFIAHEYDMQWLHREIVSSDTYQRSWRPNSTNRDERRNFSRAIPRRIPAEVMYDALKQATAATHEQDEVRTDLTRRAIGYLSMRMAGTYAMHVFGKPDRAVNCDCERVNRPTLLQAIFLQNDPLIDQRLAESGWIAEIAAATARGDVTAKQQQLYVRQAWLRTVGRPPSSDEKQAALAYVASASDAEEAMRDLLWALINTKEFALNR